MLKKYNVFIYVVLLVALAMFLNPGSATQPAEKLEILSGLGIDTLYENGENKYQVSYSAYNFGPTTDKGSASMKKAKINTVIASNLPESRQKNQLQINHKFVSALEKVVVISEKTAMGGIQNTLDLLFSNPLGNDMASMVVCKDQAITLLKYDIEGYPSAADFISGMIDHTQEYNFLSNEYSVMNAYVMVESEGRNLVLPYLEMVDNHLQITGLALFKKSKMVKKVNIEDAQILNMLREKSVRGTQSYQKNFEKYTCSYMKSNRKVKCEKNGDNYTFTIDLEFKGDLISNTLFKDLEKHTSILEQYQQDVAQQMQAMCQDFIGKMQKEYKVDCLELGRIACAKYGRSKDNDWDDIVSNADIKVNVKVHIENFGRGRYAEIES